MATSGIIIINSSSTSLHLAQNSPSPFSTVFTSPLPVPSHPHVLCPVGHVRSTSRLLQVLMVLMPTLWALACIQGPIFNLQDQEGSLAMDGIQNIHVNNSSESSSSHALNQRLRRSVVNKPTSPFVPLPKLIEMLSKLLPPEKLSSIKRTYKDCLTKKVSRHQMAGLIRKIIKDDHLLCSLVKDYNKKVREAAIIPNFGRLNINAE